MLKVDFWKSLSLQSTVAPIRRSVVKSGTNWFLLFALPSVKRVHESDDSRGAGRCFRETLLKHWSLPRSTTVLISRFNTSDNLAWRAYLLDVVELRSSASAAAVARLIAALSRWMRLSTKPPWTTAISIAARALGSTLAWSVPDCFASSRAAVSKLSR